MPPIVLNAWHEICRTVLNAICPTNMLSATAPLNYYHVFGNTDGNKHATKNDPRVSCHMLPIFDTILGTVLGTTFNTSFKINQTILEFSRPTYWMGLGGGCPQKEKGLNSLLQIPGSNMPPLAVIALLPPATALELSRRGWEPGMRAAICFICVTHSLSPSLSLSRLPTGFL